MIKQNTVFVLGAGASKHYGYPTGEELRKNIIKYFQHWYTKHFGPRFTFRNWSDMDTFEIDQELKDVKKFIDKFNLSEEQIDLFITRYPTYAKLGKLAIVLGIYHSELGEFVDPAVNDHWYRVLFSQLTDGRTEPDDFRISQNNVSFITFNYDRSLEDYLYKAIPRNFESAGPSESSKEINSIPIIHVYGKLASLDWQNTDPNVLRLEYKKDYTPLDQKAFEMRKNIFVMHDKRDNPNVEKSKELLEQAECVYFLGFGYSKENMKILDIPNTIKNAKRIYGTAYEYSDQRIVNITRNYFSPIRRDRLKIEKDMKCNDLIFNYPLSTN